MTSQGNDLSSKIEGLRVSIARMLQGRIDAIRDFLTAVSSLMPPSTDFGIEIGRRGKQVYYVDFKGVSVVMLSEDEYLPYLSSKEVRLTIDKLPEDVLKQAKQDFKRILRELVDSIMEYSKRHKEYYKVADAVSEVVLQHL
jgi:hypothetical protein